MKLSTTNNQLEVFGIDEAPSNFSIAFNAKAFKVLSSTLYSNKIGSIVREYASNAWDSHIMANKTDTPFHIHLPNAFEPWFSIEDFGVGLSKEDVLSTYTVFFKSTKDQSNDCTGMLGLGSKSAFSYTDQFTITSRCDGLKTTYSAFISQNGVPAVVEMHSEPMSDIESNGVEIRMSAKREDFNRFSGEVLEQLKYFKVKPILKNTSVKFPEDTDLSKPALYESDDCKIVETGYYSSLVVIQGNVGYALNMDTLSKSTAASDYKKAIDFINSFTRNHITFNFPIGSIGVTASREGIEYDATTVTNICKLMEKVEKDYLQSLKNKVNSQKTDWEKVYTFQASSFNFRYKDQFAFPAKFLLAMSTSYALDIDSVISTTVKEKVSVPSDFGPVVKDVTRKIARASVCVLNTGLYRGRRSRAYVNNMTVENFSNILLIGRDKSTLAERKLQYYLNSNSGKYSKVYEISSVSDVSVVDLIAELKLLMGVEVKSILLSEITLPEEEKTPTTRSAVTQYYMYDEDSTSIRKWRAIRDQKLKDITEPVYYLTHEGNYVSQDELANALIFLTNLGLDPEENLIAISASKEILVVDNPNFKNIKQLEKDCKLDLERQKLKLVKNYRRHVAKEIFHRYTNEIKFLKEISIQAPETDLASVYPLSQRLQVGIDTSDSLTSVERKLKSIGVNTDKINQTLARKAVKISDTLRKYPLLPVLSSWYIRDEVKAQDVVQYVKALHSTI